MKLLEIVHNTSHATNFHQHILSYYTFYKAPICGVFWFSGVQLIMEAFSVSLGCETSSPNKYNLKKKLTDPHGRKSTHTCVQKKKTWVKKTIVNNEFMSLKKDYVKCYFWNKQRKVFSEKCNDSQINQNFSFSFRGEGGKSCCEHGLRKVW